MRPTIHHVIGAPMSPRGGLEYIGRVHLDERLLKRPQTRSDDLVQLTLDDLRLRAGELEAVLTRE